MGGEVGAAKEVVSSGDVGGEGESSGLCGKSSLSGEEAIVVGGAGWLLWVLFTGQTVIEKASDRVCGVRGAGACGVHAAEWLFPRPCQEERAEVRREERCLSAPLPCQEQRW